MPNLAASLQNLADWLFMPWILILLMGGGIFLTVRLGWVQVRRFREALGVMVSGQSRTAGGVLTPFQTFMTALGASIGTGNIAGVATAIISGGPGALFWIWCFGFFATAIKFLGLHFREVAGGEVRSVPMYDLWDGLRAPALGWIFAFGHSMGATGLDEIPCQCSICEDSSAQISSRAGVSDAGKTFKRGAPTHPGPFLDYLLGAACTEAL
jgi:Na+/alanine symporter